MKVEFYASFNRDIGKIKDQKIKEKVARLIEQIETAVSFSTIANIKKLRGFTNAYRIRIGDYRVGIFYENKTVGFARIVHRKDIYTLFP